MPLLLFLLLLFFLGGGGSNKVCLRPAPGDPGDPDHLRGLFVTRTDTPDRNFKGRAINSFDTIASMID